MYSNATKNLVQAKVELNQVSLNLTMITKEVIETEQKLANETNNFNIATQEYNKANSNLGTPSLT